MFTLTKFELDRISNIIKQSTQSFVDKKIWDAWATTKTQKNLQNQDMNDLIEWIKANKQTQPAIKQQIINSLNAYKPTSGTSEAILYNKFSEVIDKVLT